MQEADRAGVQVPAQPPEIVAPEAVLVPPVVHRRDLPGEHQQERRERPELVDPQTLLELHPLFDLGRVPTGAPSVEVDDHDAGVEVAGRVAAAREGEGEGGAGPEGGSEVGGEVGVAVLRGGEDGGAGVEGGGGEGGDVVDEDEVGVEVDDAADAEGEEVGEVGAGVVEGAVEGGADGGGDEPRDGGGVERVELEAEVGEGGGDGGVQEGGVGGVGRVDEVEDHVLGAGGVLEDGEDGRHGAPDVGGVQGHRDVDRRVRADNVVVAVAAVIIGGGVEEGRAGWGVVEFRGFFELLGVNGGRGGAAMGDSGADGQE
ncbi:NAC domain-containing protein [Psidium guajava]|nr:NAC domain-containing protein [Psidium guajava]